MCYEKGSFTTYHSLDRPKPIYLGNSSTVNSYGIGSVWIGHTVSLFNVLHIPDLDINLLWVNKVLQHSHVVLFSGDGCMIQHGNKDVLQAVRIGNLFRINAKSWVHPMLYYGVLSNSTSSLPGFLPIPAKAPSLLPMRGQTLTLWHQILGYLN